jgi:soluble lytic murein transglycosylase
LTVKGRTAGRSLLSAVALIALACQGYAATDNAESKAATTEKKIAAKAGASNKAGTAKPSKAAASKGDAAKPASKAKSKAASKTAAKSPAKTAPALAAKDVPLPRPRPLFRTALASAGDASTPAPAANAAGPAADPLGAQPAAAQPLGFVAPLPPTFTAPTTETAALSPAQAVPLASALSPTTAAADLATIKQAAELARKGKAEEATALGKTIADPLARKLIEWLILRSDDNDADFARYAAFIAGNPGWPSIVTLRRRAEAMMWNDRPDAATVRAFFVQEKPKTAKGRFALARALLAQGDSAGAQHYVREAWRTEAFGSDLEKQARESFGDLITGADDKARMDRRIYAEDSEAALRMAHRLGATQVALAMARIAVQEKVGNAKTLLDAVPAEARHDAGYIFSRCQWLRRNDKIAEAGQLMLTAPHEAAQLHDLDEWWVERRLLARKLLDIGDAKTAYQVVRDAVTPPKENNRAESHFTAGWIALRFLNDPAAATYHFSRVGQGTSHPTTLARASYWQGRAAEAANRQQEARAHYETAARYTTSYYGQIARGRLGMSEMTLRPLPAPSAEQRASLARLEVVRAAEILYAIGERDTVAVLMADLADKTHDAGALFMLGEIATKNEDARTLLLLGKTALGRGFAMDHYAFPIFGMPRYEPIAPQIEPAMVYSIARQESGFNPRIVSSANALGLMQVTPEAGRHIAKRYNDTFDQKRLLSDVVYNVQMGAAELADVLERYRGSYVLAFAAYNAGMGRVTEWVGRYGDPRSPGVDPIDWVERIPFSETRNYVQRIIENMQVYRTRFGGGSRLLIEADLRRGAQAN